MIWVRFGLKSEEIKKWFLEGDGLCIGEFSGKKGTAQKWGILSFSGLQPPTILSLLELGM